MAETADSLTKSIGIPIARIMAVVPPFAFVVSSAYLMGYWRSFYISPFSIMSLSEAAVRAIPILPSMLILLMFVPLPVLFRRGFSLEITTRDATFWRKSIKILGVASFLIAASIHIFDVGGSFGRFVSICMMLFAVAVYSYGVVGLKFDQNEVRTMIGTTVAVLAAMPIVAYGIGLSQAQRLKDGHIYIYIANVTEDDRSLVDLRWIGHINDYYFLYVPATRTTRIISVDSFPIIDLKLCFFGREEQSFQAAFRRYGSKVTEKDITLIAESSCGTYRGP